MNYNSVLNGLKSGTVNKSIFSELVRNENWNGKYNAKIQNVTLQFNVRCI